MCKDEIETCLGDEIFGTKILAKVRRHLNRNLRVGVSVPSHFNFRRHPESESCNARETTIVSVRGSPLCDTTVVHTFDFVALMALTAWLVQVRGLEVHI